MLRGRLPDFLIIGAMRSGTTSLARYLGAHPGVYVAPNKELHFFDRAFDRGLDHYRQQFARARGDQSAGEATQTYLYDTTALDRIAATLPDVKLIAILRNPVDRAYSHYWQKRAYGREPLSFAAAVSAEPERLRGADRDERFRYSYLDRGRYVDQLQRVTERFPRTALHVLLFEDLRDAPEDTYRDVCRFLQVNEDMTPANIGEPLNPFLMFRSRRLREVSRRFPPRLRNAVGRINARKGDYEPLDPGLRAELVEYFAAPNAALAAWLGRDLSVWNGA
ncbi:MAG: hypothetical protein QOD92_3782 [Acidimicrobiaceae bacterium]|jgi:hypothetical protein